MSEPTQTSFFHGEAVIEAMRHRGPPTAYRTIGETLILEWESRDRLTRFSIDGSDIKKQQFCDGELFSEEKIETELITGDA